MCQRVVVIVVYETKAQSYGKKNARIQGVVTREEEQHVHHCTRRPLRLSAIYNTCLQSCSAAGCQSGFNVPPWPHMSPLQWARSRLWQRPARWLSTHRTNNHCCCNNTSGEEPLSNTANHRHQQQQQQQHYHQHLHHKQQISFCGSCKYW